MMVVVSDTGPLRYLIQIGAIDALPKLYSVLLTTPVVMRELQLAHCPTEVRSWSERPPTWLKIESPATTEFLEKLDEGEATALSLARERSAALILIDERDGTALARTLGFEAYGTLGVIALAGARGHIHFERALERLLTATHFRHSPEIIERTRQRFAELCRDQ
jgi:predicted nucleic acid-binding protein